MLISLLRFQIHYHNSGIFTAFYFSHTLSCSLAPLAAFRLPPCEDNESVTGMPGLAERANYDASDDEEMTDFNDEAPPGGESEDKDDDAGHGYGNDDDSEGEEVISFSTVNPGECRIATCPRLASTCKQHRSHVDNGTKSRYPAGFYLARATTVTSWVLSIYPFSR